MVKEVTILRGDIVLDIPSVGGNAFRQKLDSEVLTVGHAEGRGTA